MTEGGIFNKYSINIRMSLFYYICIWVRLLLAYFVYKYGNNNKILYLILIFSIISIYLNFSKKNKVWWKRQFHGIIAILVLIITLLVIKGILNYKFISYLLFIDVLFGFLYSLYIKPFI